VSERQQRQKHRRGKRYHGPGVGPNADPLVVDVKSLQRSEEERQETRRLGTSGTPTRDRLTDVQKRAAEMVRQSQGELPPWWE
jgi:hypothetical protein